MTAHWGMVLFLWDMGLGFGKSLYTPGLGNLSLLVSRCQQWSLHPFQVSDYIVCCSKVQIFAPWGCRVMQIWQEGTHRIRHSSCRSLLTLSSCCPLFYETQSAFEKASFINKIYSFRFWQVTFQKKAHCVLM